MPAPTSGLARITIRAPRRRIDLAVPAQVPLAELLPEVVRRSGEVSAGPQVTPPGGWVLRRGDGASLQGDAALAPQGVRDGDVLYLVPWDLTWPEPVYDDVVEEIAAAARERGQLWTTSYTRLLALVTAGLVLLVALTVLVVAGADTVGAGLVAAGLSVLLLAVGGVLSRAWGDGRAGAATGGFALAYAAASGVLLAGAGSPDLRPEHCLVGASALLFASVVGAVAVGSGLRIFACGVTVGILASVGALSTLAVSVPGAASIIAIASVAGIGLAPVIAVRLGRLPRPVVSASAEVLATERRPEHPQVLAAVARADEILAGLILGIAVVALGCVAILAGTTGVAGPLLGALASVGLLLRSRLYPTVAAKLPLLLAGTLALAAVTVLMVASPALPTPGVLSSGLAVVGMAVAVVVVLLGIVVVAPRREREPSPYLSRLADIADMAVLVALVPVGCAVLGLYAWVRGVSG